MTDYEENKTNDFFSINQEKEKDINNNSYYSYCKSNHKNNNSLKRNHSLNNYINYKKLEDIKIDNNNYYIPRLLTMKTNINEIDFNYNNRPSYRSSYFVKDYYRNELNKMNKDLFKKERKPKKSIKI